MSWTCNFCICQNDTPLPYCAYCKHQRIPQSLWNAWKCSYCFCQNNTNLPYCQHCQHQRGDINNNKSNGNCTQITQHQRDGRACKLSNCYEIRRIISALIFYSTTDPINNKKHESKFMEYFNEIYPELLDDYIHIMDHHQYDMEQVLKVLKSDMELLSECNINNCVAIKRHFRDRERDKITPSISWKCQQCNSMNPQCPKCCEIAHELTFYIDILDSIHCHWYHSFDLGLRVRNDDIKQLKDDEADEQSYYDQEFAKRQKLISQRQREVKNIAVLRNRFGKKNYCLPIAKKKIDTEGNIHLIFSVIINSVLYSDLFRDRLFYVMTRNGMLDVINILTEEEYDTDAINQDNNSNSNQNNSNICNIFCCHPI